MRRKWQAALVPSLFFFCKITASVAILPSALLNEPFGLYASWAFSFQWVLQSVFRPRVSPDVHVFALGLLRGHVRRSSEDNAYLSGSQRQRRGIFTILGRDGFGAKGFGQSEVQQLHDAIRRDLDVGGLQIAMDDSLVVRVLQRIGDLRADLPS